VSPSTPGLEDLAARYGLSPGSEAQLEALICAISTNLHAPTSIRDANSVMKAHITDSLSALETSFVSEASAIADLGSGAGFPGLPLAIALPGARVALVEATGRKCDFLRGLVEGLDLANVEVVHARAEEWAEGLGRHDLVTARALAPLATLVEYAAPLLEVGGRLVAWKGRPESAEEADGAAAAVTLGMEAERMVSVQPFPEAQNRRLYVYLKVGSTPNGYPRRAGMARKRPLRASTAGPG